METTTNNRMTGLLSLYDLHTDYFNRALDALTDEDAHKRLDTKANHIAWIAGSLLHERFEMAKRFGYKELPVTNDLFANHQGIKDDVKYPSLEDYKNDWAKVSPVLKEFLGDVTDEKLDEVIDMGEWKMSFYELLTFMTYREASCIGQIALWRRLLGYKAMNYM